MPFSSTISLGCLRVQETTMNEDKIIEKKYFIGSKSLDFKNKKRFDLSQTFSII
jgi:hypothetical protein